jgi:hypothetical protein
MGERGALKAFLNAPPSSRFAAINLEWNTEPLGKTLRATQCILHAEGLVTPTHIFAGGVRLRCSKYPKKV